MLYLVSLGLSDCEEMSIKALKILQKCDTVLLENYTNTFNCDKQNLEKTIGKSVELAQREKLEQGLEQVLEQAKKENVAIAVSGDALTATTHHQLMIDAQKKGIGCKIIHGSSIFTAIAETGLQLYKFGYTVTIPSWSENYQPTSFYKKIILNKDNGMHTLLLLDINMGVNQAIEILEATDKKLLTQNNIIACAALGSSEKIIAYGAAQAVKKMNIDKKPAVLIIPGELHFKEEEMLQMFKI